MSQKIRIAIVNEGTAGGLRKRLFNVAHTIDRERFEITFVLSGNRKGYTAESDPIRELENNGIPRIHLPMVREISPFTDLQSLKALRRIFRENPFDLIHGHCAKAGFLIRMAHRLDPSIPCIYSPHVFAFQRVQGLQKTLYLSLERIAAKWANAFIVDSSGEKEWALKLGFPNPDRVFVLPEAVAPASSALKSARSSVRDLFQIDEKRIVFLTAARLVHYKGQKQIIHAFHDVTKKHQNVELWIAGDGEQKGDLEKTALQSHLVNRVRFLGHRSDIYELLAASDCFILASNAEGSPHSILEALALEKPIIATAVSGTIDFVHNLPSCRLVPWNDVPALSDAMESFVRSPITGTPVELLPREWFDIQGQVRKLENIYEEVIHQQKNGAHPVGL